MIAIFYALEAEIKDLKKGRDLDPLYGRGDCRVSRTRFNRKEILLVSTGVGKERALDTIKYAMRSYPISTVISTGFAGALNEKTSAGDVITASRMEVECAGWNERPVVADARLVAVAQHIQPGKGFNSLTGTGVTVGEVCATTAAKRKLCTEFKADFVDMESYWIGRAAATGNLPFLIVRAVSDSVQDDLSFIGEITSEGKVLPGKIIRYFISHPVDLPRKIGLSAQIAKTGKNLAWFLERLIAQIEPGV
ncbi:MAG TPA: hypothetical protein VF318_06975 [Dehalococcoidales bacterium]